MSLIQKISFLSFVIINISYATSSWSHNYYPECYVKNGKICCLDENGNEHCRPKISE